MKQPSFSTLPVRLARRPAATLIACALLTACTTTQRSPRGYPDKMVSEVRVGDYVTCTLTDGSRAAFEVTTVEASALRGDSRAVAVPEIVQIEINRFSGGKTVVLAGTVAGLAALATTPGGAATIALLSIAGVQLWHVPAPR